ncbi:MAG: FecR domain-containing protein, partial [Verrucomicrobia bacterium]|nr:FecR domain-containing protein [Verrucomicrobiota bacterium]
MKTNLRSPRCKNRLGTNFDPALAILTSAPHFSPAALLRRMKTIGSNLIGFLLAGSLSLSAADLAQSKFTQVVGEVSIVDAITKQVRKAEVNGLVKAPDLVRTGPNSRAELLAGDQTLTRIGANTIFSFESRGRGVNLQQGSVLFHSPKGKGGGVIKSGGSSAAVLGTTLIVSANPQGGFKTILLEGIGRVTSAGSSSRRLDAGQVVFTLPQGGLSQTFNVDLGRLVDGSALMRGYSAPLPSLAQVSAAVAKQESLKTEGRLQDTGLIVGNKASKEGIAVIDPGTFTAALREKKSSVEKAWDRDAKVDETYLPERLLFVRSEPRYPKNSPWHDAVTDVALAAELKIKSRDLVIPTIELNEPSRTFGLIAKKLEIEGDLDIHPPDGGGPQDPDLVIGGRSTHVSD